MNTTELTQREKFESWWERAYHNGNPPRFGWESWRDGDGYKIDDDESELDGMWNAWQAANSELVEALESAHRKIAELESRADAEPVGFRWRWVDAGEGPGEWWYHDMQHFDAVSRDKNRECQLIYTRPQPAPVVVPDERSAFEAFMAKRFGDIVDQRRVKNGDQEYMAWDMAVAWVVWSGRAAMLQGKAEPVSQPYTLPECFDRLFKHAQGLTFGDDWNRGTAAKYHRDSLIKAVDDCREMLAAAPQQESDNG